VSASETNPVSSQSALPRPASTLYDEGGSVSSWLKADWDFNDIRYEWDYRFNEYLPLADQLDTVWFLPRWTTREELEDEDLLYEFFGDHELNGVCTDVVYEQVRPLTRNAHAYWTVD
jgi:hypothetical protein